MTPPTARRRWLEGFALRAIAAGVVATTVSCRGPVPGSESAAICRPGGAGTSWTSAVERDVRKLCGPPESNCPVRVGETRAAVHAALAPCTFEAAADGAEALHLSATRSLVFFLSIEDGLIGSRRESFPMTLRVYYGPGGRVSAWKIKGEP